MAGKNKRRQLVCRVKSCLRPISGLHGSLKVIGEDLKLPTYLLKGPEVSTGADLTIEYRGREIQKNYIARLAFGESWHETKLGSQFIWQKIKPSRADKTGLVLFEVTNQLASILARFGCIRIPVFLDGVMDIASIDLAHRDLKFDVRRFQKNGLTSEITADRDLIKWCYRELCLPYADERYKGETFLVRPEELDRADIQMEVIFIKKGQERVAGMVLYHRSDSIASRFLGVKVPSRELVESGIHSAMYYALYHCAKEKQVKQVDLGGTRPFFQDGVFIFKRKWGLVLTGCSDKNMCVFRKSDTPGVRGFLNNNPFVAIEGKDLVGMIFSYGKEDRNISRYSVERWPGLKKFVFA